MKKYRAYKPKYVPILISYMIKLRCMNMSHWYNFQFPKLYLGTDSLSDYTHLYHITVVFDSLPVFSSPNSAKNLLCLIVWSV